MEPQSMYYLSEIRHTTSEDLEVTTAKAWSYLIDLFDEWTDD